MKQGQMKITWCLFLLLVTTPVAFASEFIRAPSPKVPGEYMVVFMNDFRAIDEASALANVHAATVAQLWEHALNGALCTSMSEAAAQALARNPRIAWVEEHGIATIVATQTQNSTPSWGLDRVDQRTLPLDTAYHYASDGTGVPVYVLDTGIRASHNDFGGRVTLDDDTIGDGQNGNDCHGHGTHVAGTIGGSTYGVAKKVSLHAVRVLNCAGSGTYAQVISGVDWVTAHHGSTTVVANMSLGGGASDALDLAVNNSVTAGVFYAVAAGNSTADACNYSPARAAQASTVGATTSSDARSSFSNSGTCVDMFAPGSSITSDWSTSDTATTTISGTSMASPHVAGTAALLLDEHSVLTPNDLKAELTRRATPGVLSTIGSGSPNLLLFTRHDGRPAPTCKLVNAACTLTTDCCSGRCRGKVGKTVCK